MPDVASANGNGLVLPDVLGTPAKITTKADRLQPRRWLVGGWLMLERIIGHLDPAALPYVYQDENGEIQVGEGEDYQRRFREARDRLYQAGVPGQLAAPSPCSRRAVRDTRPACADAHLAADTDCLASSRR